MPKSQKEKNFKKIVIYKPIERINKAEDFPEKRKDKQQNFWELFSKRQQQIDEWGDDLQAYITHKHHKSQEVSVVQHAKNSENILAGLSAKDTVYVHSHGNCTKLGLRPYFLSPEKLAKRMNKDGLPKKGTPQIKFWSCNSGTPHPEEGKDQFAKAVGKELKKLNYGAFTTFGYEGEVMAIRDPKQKMKEVRYKSKRGDIKTRANSRRVKFAFP